MERFRRPQAPCASATPASLQYWETILVALAEAVNISKETERNLRADAQVVLSGEITPISFAACESGLKSATLAALAR